MSKPASAGAAHDNVVALSAHPDKATRVSQKVENGEELNLTDRLSVYQRLNREWRHYLTTNEMSLMAYVVDRTVGWGRVSFTACTDNVLGGNDDFAGMSPGMSRAVYFRTLKGLEDKGIIARKSLRDRTRVTLNVGWSGPKTEDTSMLPVPKRAQKASESSEEATQEGQESQYETSRSVDLRPQESQSDTLNKGSGNKGNTTLADARAASLDVPQRKSPPNSLRNKTKDQSNPACPNLGQTGEDAKAAPVEAPEGELPLQPVADVRSRLEGQQQAHRARMQASAESARKSTRMNATMAETIWKAALAETFPDYAHVGWGRKEQGRINQTIKKWVAPRKGTFGELIDYSVRNWPQIIRRKFSWMTKSEPPKTPDLAFFLWQIDAFTSFWLSGELDRFAKDHDNDRLARLKARGFSHDDAIREMARQDAVKATNEETRKRVAEANRKERAAREREERAERFEGLADKHGGQGSGVIQPGTERRPGQAWGHQGGVIHPTSPAAKRMARTQAAQEREEAPAPAAPEERTESKPQAPLFDLPGSYEELRRQRAERLHAQNSTKTENGGDDQ